MTKPHRRLTYRQMMALQMLFSALLLSNSLNIRNICALVNALPIFEPSSTEAMAETPNPSHQ
ncbi:MAG: hypothetical protein AAFQ63_14265 [Cyanobacteria bacterium J06621_11]